MTHALAAQKERHGLPELHVWVNQTVPSFQPDPPEVLDEKIAQWRGLKRFIERWTKSSEDGSFVGSFTAYHTVAEFQELFEIKLRKSSNAVSRFLRARSLRRQNRSGPMARPSAASSRSISRRASAKAPTRFWKSIA